jgi:Cyclic nucleotide-binding domain
LGGRRLVRAAGLEPARDYSQRILSPLRLPLRHARTFSCALIGETRCVDKRLPTTTKKVKQAAMDNILTSPDLLVHLSYVMIAFSYFLTNMLWLRVVACIGLSLNLVYYAITGSSFHTSLPWDSIFIIINLYELALLMRERWNAKLPEADAPLLRHAFEGLNDVQISKLLRAADWKSLAAGDIVTRQDAPVDALYFIIQGRAQVEVDGITIAHLESGTFIGEIAYLTGNPATARVVIEEPSRLLVFSRMRMAKVTAGDKQINGILYQVLGRDLATKMRRANSAKVFEQSALKS